MIFLYRVINNLKKLFIFKQLSQVIATSMIFLCQDLKHVSRIA
ncbi:hypothetical protein BA6E_125136 [Bacteroidales bacterium 6E]|nr:hypothetical protein BA6E_125136 [Bacteroidales bacterium 6E]